MKKILLALIFLTLALHLPAQTNGSVRLALIAETDEAAPALDILTAELSSRTNLQLLERNEIKKVYQEQALLAGNRDYVKLGRILGADGLLLLGTARQGTNEWLNVRLVAVKPGVVLLAERFDWPLSNLAEWSQAFSSHLGSVLPKLAVAVKNVIPISVVNFRSAIASTEELEAEQELKLLGIQRLSRQQQVFVLERERMESLSEEKDLNSDDMAFWDGSYLLEGVVDKDGYSEDVLTLDIRLTPPKGGSPLSIQLSGSRTNLPEIVDRLAAKIIAALNVEPTIPGWNAKDEAAQYLDEARWALQWKVYSEALAAADSAWALGRHDMECETLRIQAHEGLLHTPRINEEGTFDPVIIKNLALSDPNYLAEQLREISRSHPGVYFETNMNSIGYVCMDSLPSANDLKHAFQALELYYEFSQGLTNQDAWLVSSPLSNYRVDSDWYRLGIDDLNRVSAILEVFNLFPAAQKGNIDELGTLRARARAVARLISQQPVVHDSYFVGDRFVTHDELGNTIGESPNIFNCKLTWGSVWQEKPEDCVAIYHDLMQSPVFSYIHKTFWAHRLQAPDHVRAPNHDLQPPRLVAWNERDRQQIPGIWTAFTNGLSDSTNLLFQLEAKALAFADAETKKDMGQTFTNYFEALLASRDALLNNNVEVVYLDWGSGDLVSVQRGMISWPISIPDELRLKYYHDYYPKLEAMESDYWAKVVPAQQIRAAVETQKEYLRQNTPYDFSKFAQTFAERNYSRAEALELEPLIENYQSNLVARAQIATAREKGQLRMAISFVGDLAQDVNKLTIPPVVTTSSPVPPAPRPQPVMAQPVAVTVPPVAPPKARDTITNILMVERFEPIPLAGLRQLVGATENMDSRCMVTAHHWVEDKLVLNFNYEFSDSYNGQQRAGTAVAIFDPATGHWEVVLSTQPESVLEGLNSHSTLLWHGELVDSDNNQIRKYDPAGLQWQVLPISDGGKYELFAVNEHLYAANENIIFEILEGGKSTRILASTRRQPPASTLDTINLGTPALFEGPGHSLRVSTADKIFTWTNNDWHEDSAIPPFSSPPEITPDGAFFRDKGDGEGLPATISYLPVASNRAELCLWQRIYSPNITQSPWVMAKAPRDPGLFWKLPSDVVLANLPVAGNQTNLYLFEDHSETHHSLINRQQDTIKVGDRDGYDATLLCFSPGLPRPQKIFLRFDAPGGIPPVLGIHPGFPDHPSIWMLYTTNFLFCSLEDRNQFVNMNTPYKPGVWMIPAGNLMSRVQELRTSQLDEMTQSLNANKQSSQNLLEKYDHDRDGTIDLKEREEALDDPIFIASELDVIDANHNDQLEAPELAYFDANQNKILDAKEQAGIDIAQHLLAVRLLEKFDTAGKGYLDPSEFDEAMQSGMDPRELVMQRAMQSLGSHEFADANHDGHIDAGELEAYLKKQMRAGLRIPHRLGMMINPPMNRPSQPVDPRQAFKSAVEAYWNNTNNITNQFPPNSVR